MKVITENDIIIQKGDNMSNIYSAVNGGKLKDKAKALVGSGKVAGVLAALSGGNNGQGGNTPAPAPIPEKKKMSIGVKIAIGVGALALIGGIIYLVKKKK